MAIHNIGEKPGKGKYCCTKCNWSVVLDNATDTLPPSTWREPACRSSYFRGS